jgi:hypothetical protein
MFRMAFHGGFGNVWNALMTIPEVSKQIMDLNYGFMSCEISNAD